MNKTEWEQSIDLTVENPSYPQASEAVQRLPLIELSNTNRLRDAEAVISKVVEVAESNHTSERILERKHEVKDFVAKDTQKQQFASRISEILGTQPSLQRSYAYYQQSNAQPSSKTAVLKRLLTTNSLYGYAIRYGFISAVISLVIAVIIVTLFT